MNSNPTTDNDLQKAIDEITNNTNSDPIFADPVAAPAPIPVQNPMEGFGEAPVPPAAQQAMQARPAAGHASTPMRPPMPPMPSQQAFPRPATNRPSGNQNSAPRPVSRPAMSNQPAMRPAPANAPRPPMPARPAAQPVAANPMRETVPTPTPAPAKMEKMESFTSSATEFSEPATPANYNTGIAKTTPNAVINPEMAEIRDAALRDLSKVIDKLDVTPAEKFDVYKEVHDNFGDDSVFAPAYKAASEMNDDKERGEALLYLVKSLGGDK